jgi:hypothetical protein
MFTCRLSVVMMLHDIPDIYRTRVSLGVSDDGLALVI